ncbi:aldehyde dehydrogenase family protein [Streptomyces sp. NBC_01356]|uniref:aldehyde dehydrogenase family protein n=1 Tax=Streptomyces sp. NBC_01356 TaxID=2903836 RepID=UPI002E377545|nr:aldehyde dehydrogenase family protein [Streptomyces sp. NBC_01356]
MTQTRTVTAAADSAHAGIAVDNPATGEVVGHVADTPAEEVVSAVLRARQAQAGWARLSPRTRAELFTRSRRWLLAHRQEITDSIVAENGKAEEDAIVEVVYCVSAFAYWAKHARRLLADTKVRSLSPFVLGRSMYTRRAPVGVVGVIGPWNNPLINSFGDAIPALAAGNAVVLKPSEYTPLTARLMEQMTRECGWPDGVFQVVTGAGATGQALVEAADFVMFTGSTKTGRAVAARAGERLIPCSLELGGKDALIVLADASVERAVNVALHGALFNAGQTCTSVERVYVEAPVYDEFVARLEERFREVTMGRPAGLGSTDLGAMTFPPQMGIVEDQVTDAVSRGARVLVGGHAAPGPGRFFEPTLLVNVDHTMKCMREETFGPTLPVMKVADAEEAVRLANDSEYGLQATIIGSNMTRARQLAARLEAGCVTINDAQSNYLALGLPMGGWKASGVGVRHGAEGFRKYTKLQAISVNRFPMRRDLHMLPFDPSSYRFILRLVNAMYGKRLRSDQK